MLVLKDKIEAYRAYVSKIRREFHRFPELSLNEFRTAKRVEEELDRMGIAHQRIGETGVLGIIKGSLQGSSHVVALRADMDALPIQETNDLAFRSVNKGIMHACGHDGHTAVLLGSARILSELRGYFSGEVRLIFQPAEEIGKGAKPFIEAGIMRGVDRVFGLHTAYDVPTGKVVLKPGLNNASVDFFRITVRGKAAHVSTPQLGVDALLVASQIVTSAQAIVTRLYSPVEPLILGIGKLEAGTTYNALAQTAVLEGTTRTVSLETRMKVKSQLETLVQNIAASYGATAELFWDDFTPPLFNDEVVCREAAKVTEALFGEGHVLFERPLSLAGDNYAEFLLEAPGAYAYLGTGSASKPGTLNPQHNGNFDIDEEALAMGMGLLSAYALSVLQTAEAMGSGTVSA